MDYDVDESEILSTERSVEWGVRLTRFNCTRCKKPLSEADLSAIRAAHAPCMHYDCLSDKKGDL